MCIRDSFYSIKLSTVAIGLLTFSTFPIFVTFLEPIFFKEKLHIKDIIVALVTFSGIFFVVPKFDFADNMTMGAIWGVISGVSYALFSLGNRNMVKKYSGSVVSLYEQLTVVMILTPYYLLFNKETAPLKEILLIALLGIVFTALAHTLAISALKHIKAKTSSIIFCLEPLYAIVAASFILNEVPSQRTIIGGVIILGTVLYSTLTSKK